MDYEALGRYTEASEKAKEAANALHNSFAELSRHVSTGCSFQPTGYVANEMDFVAIREITDRAEKHYGEVVSLVNTANHEATACGRKPLILFKRSGL